MPRERDPPAGEAVLALDVGTSSVRCLAYDRQARAVAGVHAAREIEPRLTRDGGMELDAERLLQATLACLAEAAGALAARGGQAAAVAVSTFWHGLLGVDSAGHPATPLYLWSDQRSGPAALALRRELDGGAIHRRTGCVLHSSYWPAKLRWLRERDAAAFTRVARWVNFGEYLERRLFGVWRVSPSMASGTGLLDQAKREWDAELLLALGIDAARLSPVRPTREPLSGITPTLGGQLYALRRVPFFPALGDGACSNLGCGATRPGEGALMIGTSAALRVLFGEHSPDPAPPPPPGLWRYLLDERRALIGGALSNGGNLFAWLTHALRLEGPEVLENALAKAEPDAHGLTVLPFLAGERNPDYPLDATGLIAGLRASTTPFDIFQAGLEAVAYRAAAIAGRLRAAHPALERFIATGGLLRSPAWTQMLADVLGLLLETTDVPEASSRGAALMAQEALGWLPSALEAPPERGRVCPPNPARQKRYAAARERHEALYRRIVLEQERE
jgi:gluconokinase